MGRCLRKARMENSETRQETIAEGATAEAEKKETPEDKGTTGKRIRVTRGRGIRRDRSTWTDTVPRPSPPTRTPGEFPAKGSRDG